MIASAAALLAAVAALSASPERVSLAGGAAAPVELTNHGAAPLVVEARPGALVLDARGRPRLVANTVRRRAARWLSIRPTVVSIQPGRTARLTVAASPPRRAEPGDHHALVLLTTRQLARANVAVRLRLGIRVVVRVPGRIVRRLELRGIRVRRGGSRRALAVTVANRGNVTERPRLTLTLFRRGRRIAAVRTGARELLPRSTGIFEARYRGRLRGRLTVLVEVQAPVPVRRAFAIRL